MEILINLLIVCAKFIPAYVLIAIAYLINKRYPLSESVTKETGLKNSHITIFKGWFYYCDGYHGVHRRYGPDAGAEELHYS